MTESERERDRTREPVAAPDADALDHTGPTGRPSTRRDPAAMRQTLDAARRRLGPSDPGGGPTQSASHQRALLREAVASQAVPLTAGPTEPTSPATSPTGPTEDATAAADADPDHQD